MCEISNLAIYYIIFAGAKKEEKIITTKLCDVVWMFIQGEHDRGNVVGLNQNTGEPINPQMEGIFDNYSVKRQLINSGYIGTPRLDSYFLFQKFFFFKLPSSDDGVFFLSCFL